MQNEILLLDLCCKAGGAAMGYKQAADDLGLKIFIVGIDIEPQPNYPFEFIQDDAVSFLAKNGKSFTHVHASPPCQLYTQATAEMRKKGKVYRDNLPMIQELMYKTERPGVIENVPTAPIRKDVVLRGDMFGLKVLRKRHFELVNWFQLQHELPGKVGSVKDGDYVSVYGKCAIKKSTGVISHPKFRKRTIKETWAFAMGIDWMKKDAELSEAIPPAYTRYIGKNFLLQ